MTPEFTDDPRCACWPFWALELTPTASVAEIEKAARDLTAKLQFGVVEAERFATPLGPQSRDVYCLREAKALLQDPAARLLAEFWYVEPAVTAHTDDSEAEPEDWDLPRWLAALRIDRWVR